MRADRHRGRGLARLEGSSRMGLASRDAGNCRLLGCVRRPRQRTGAPVQTIRGKSSDEGDLIETRQPGRAALRGQSCVATHIDVWLDASGVCPSQSATVEYDGSIASIVNPTVQHRC